MTDIVAFEANRFTSAAQYYIAGRPAYSPRLIERVAQITGLRRHHRVLDLGCGPGVLAVAFAPLAGEILALDPEPEMLRLAEDSARRANLPITFAEGSSYDLGPQFGAFHLVVIGRAFHWMDRRETLQRLDDLVDPEGSVTLFSDQHPELPENGWRSEFHAILDIYNKGDYARIARKSPDWLKHESILLDSSFRQLERISIIERRQTAIETLVDRAFSLSSTSPSRIGNDKAGELAHRIREDLAPYAKDGAITEVLATEALIARRPTTAASPQV